MSEGSIDDRIQFLLKSQESLTEDIRELYRTTAEHTKQLEAQERETSRMRRAMFAALQAYLNDNGDNEGNNNPQ